MRGPFDDEDFEHRKSNGDAELTLGAGTLLLLFAGLVVVCGVCFGFGYIVGHRGAAPQTAAQGSADVQTAPQANDSQSKPSATTQTAVAAPAQAAPPVDTMTQPATTDLPQSAAAVPGSSTQGASPGVAQPQVRPALPAASTSPQTATAYPSNTATSVAQPHVQPAPMPPGVVLWVQVAAVSHVEDAQVLANALKKHGYAVTPRREADNLIHVRVGPFSSRDDANRWRAKLLDDGYNAEIQQ